MESDEYFVALRREGEAFAKACADNLAAEVPSCPGWNVRTLLSHLGRVHIWATEAIGDKTGAAPERFPSAPDVVTPAWYLDALEELLKTLSDTDLEATRWTFSPSHHQAWFWLRRQALETAVHRWDAQRSRTNAPEPIEPALATEGIDELLTVFGPLAIGGTAPFDLGGTMHLHATDHNGEWVLATHDSNLFVERTHTKATVAVQGHASDLYLWLWKRIDADDLTIFGDTSLLTAWQSINWGT